MSTARSWLVLLMLAAASVSASAQDQSSGETSAGSREELLVAEREKKATQRLPPQRSKVEYALSRYDDLHVPFILESWHGFHLAGGSFPAGAGTKFGVGFTHDLGPTRPAADPNRQNRAELDGVAAYSTRGYSRGAAGLNLHRLGGAALDVRVRAQHYEYPQEDFFGFGQDSLEDNRTNYLLRSTDVGAEVQWRTLKLLDFAGGVSYLKPTVGRGTDTRFPSTGELFEPVTIPGYERQPDFVRTDTSVALDWRDNPLHSHAGGRYAVQFSDFRDRNLDTFGFGRVAIDLQQYMPIPDRYRTIALHAAAVFTDPRAGQEVPFYLQPTLGGAQALRGFREFRFQDRNSLILTAEYRWEAWWALDGAFFIDAGKVAAERRHLDLKNLDVSYGLGFRVHSNSAFIARLDLAFSREGFIPLLRFEHAF